MSAATEAALALVAKWELKSPGDWPGPTFNPSRVGGRRGLNSASSVDHTDPDAILAGRAA